MSMEQRLTGSHTAKRYALWRSRQAVLNALISDAGDSGYRPDDATADAIASLGEVLSVSWNTGARCTDHECANSLTEQDAPGTRQHAAPRTSTPSGSQRNRNSAAPSLPRVTPQYTAPTTAMPTALRHREPLLCPVCPHGTQHAASCMSKAAGSQRKVLARLLHVLPLLAGLLYSVLTTDATARHLHSLPCCMRLLHSLSCRLGELPDLPCACLQGPRWRP